MRGAAAAATLLIPAFLVAACTGGDGGGPDEQDIRTALTQAGNRGGPKAVKLACQRGADKPGFVCDYRAPVCSRFSNACGSPKPGSGRFVKSGGRWQLVEDLSPRADAAPGTQPLSGPGTTPADGPAATATSPAITFSPVPNDGRIAGPSVPTYAPEPAPMDDAPPRRAPDRADPSDRAPLKSRDRDMIARWVKLTARCQIDEGVSPSAREACFDRDDLAQRMRRRGLCYGGGGIETVAKWHRCD